jgi:anti-anti-sigma factor
VDRADLRLRYDADSTVYLAGELDMDSAERFTGAALSYADGQRELTLDLSELTFLDSGGIRAILRLAQAMPPVTVVVRHPHTNVKRALDIVQIDRFDIRVEE